MLKALFPKLLLSFTLVIFLFSCSNRANENGKNSSSSPSGVVEVEISQELIKEKDEAIAQLNKDIDNLRAAIVSKDGAIVELNAQLEAMHSDNQGLTTSLANMMDTHKSTKVRLYLLLAILGASIILNIILILLLYKAKSSNYVREGRGDSIADEALSSEEGNELPKRGRGRPKGTFKKVEEEVVEEDTSHNGDDDNK